MGFLEAKIPSGLAHRRGKAEAVTGLFGSRITADRDAAMKLEGTCPEEL